MKSEFRTLYSHGYNSHRYNSHKYSHRYNGFSLLELMIVLAIMSVIAMVALPSSNNALNAQKIKESLKLVETFKSSVANFYVLQGRFPISNEELLIPEADKLKGNYVSAIYHVKGAFHIELGNKIPPSLQSKLVTVQPVFVPNSPASPISWVCGFDEVPEGMERAGENWTNVPKVSLPGSCR